MFRARAPIFILDRWPNYVVVKATPPHHHHHPTYTYTHMAFWKRNWSSNCSHFHFYSVFRQWRSTGCSSRFNCLRLTVRISQNKTATWFFFVLKDQKNITLAFKVSEATWFSRRFLFQTLDWKSKKTIHVPFSKTFIIFSVFSVFIKVLNHPSSKKKGFSTLCSHIASSLWSASLKSVPSIFMPAAQGFKINLLFCCCSQVRGSTWFTAKQGVKSPHPWDASPKTLTRRVYHHASK